MNTEPKIYSFDSSLLPDANPKDGFCVDLVRVGDYAALKAERDAQQKRADALALENAALKDAITTHSQSTHFCELCGKDDPCSTDDVCYALNETPATDTALAAIQAQGVEKFVTKVAKQLREAGGERGYNLVDWCEYADHLEDRGEKFAAELREAK